MAELGDYLPSKRHLIEITLLAAISFVLLNPWEWSLAIFTSNLTPESIKSAVLQLGPFAPLGQIFLEWLQVVIAPLPPVTMIASGYTFGLIEGGLYSYIGMTLGSTTAILLGRLYGRNLVYKIVSDEHVQKFEDLTKDHGLLVFTAIFIAPGFPDDIICYVAGMTDLNLRKLVIVASLGRMPALMALVLTGNSIAASQVKLTAATLGVFIGTSLICVKKEKYIINKASEVENSIIRAIGFKF